MPLCASSLAFSPSIRWRPRCSAGTGRTAPEKGSQPCDRTSELSFSDGDLGPVRKFRMSDFAVCDRVSVGLQGRRDEVIFEATVRDPNSPLYNSRVVLRDLTSAQAKRRGRRALEVLKKLVRRQLMYHSYAMQVHGYVSPSGSEEGDPFILVHGYQGSYSLRHWLLLSDWLPTLEATLALDEEWVRRVGDDTIGGPDVTRQLRLIRIIMRDLLIGVNYLHSHGLAHTELRLENVHICPVDRHIKIGSNPKGPRQREVEFCKSLSFGAASSNFVPVRRNSWKSRRELATFGPSRRLQSVLAFVVGPSSARMSCVCTWTGIMNPLMYAYVRIGPDLFRVYDCSMLIDLVHIKGRKGACQSYVEVGILGNAVDLHNDDNNGAMTGNSDRKAMMIAFDMRCVGFMMAKMVLKELMDPSTFTKFKLFLNKMLDRNWGAGWNLLSLFLATKPFARISCLDALRHPFLCGPKWRIDPSMDLIRWGLGSTAVRMSEDYIYGRHQNWMEILHGRWRLLYCTGRHLGLTLRQPSRRVIIGSAYLTFTNDDNSDEPSLLLTSNISFKIMPISSWPHDKSGSPGSLLVKSKAKITSGRRLYLREEDGVMPSQFSSQESISSVLLSKKWKGVGSVKELPYSLPAAKLLHGEIDVSMNLEQSSPSTIGEAQTVLKEVRTQIPPEMFDISKLVCGTYIDSRMLVLRGVNGSALLFTRSSALN
ncbi:hypothetical protein IEQ34_007280 [Dendrobium chrysotoxum]|uniref:Protein kinase domain-containing protein n=1 Tax=Dendrobium chrysotoxum TaxID=161865 RepID=A0AAV7H9W1_DENCH|nr:hypothetical protein IEQ34_007280 [Dendrobium chrysotoxum]